jgi:hypothetical protein
MSDSPPGDRGLSELKTVDASLLTVRFEKLSSKSTLGEIDKLCCDLKYDAAEERATLFLIEVFDSSGPL